METNKVVMAAHRHKATDIFNSFRNETDSLNPNQNYCSPLTCLVEELKIHNSGDHNKSKEEEETESNDESAAMSSAFNDICVQVLSNFVSSFLLNRIRCLTKYIKKCQNNGKY